MKTNRKQNENKLKAECNQTESRMKAECTQNETNKNEKNEENDKNEKKEELIYPFTSENFLMMWDNWKKFKKETFKFKYSSILSEQAALKKLSDISQGDETVAIKIIEESISNNWQGLFPLKNGKQANKTGKSGIDLEAGFAFINAMHNQKHK